VNALTQDRWARLWRQVSSGAGAPESIYQELVSLYVQPHRHYHNLRHLAECLAAFDSVRSMANQPVAIELAIWFHDTVYRYAGSG
jgi:predicted metal-dependent HD superfamily phosphohydrolase